MATKLFCDYCGQQIETYKGPITIKMFTAELDDYRSRVFHELCDGCYDQIKQQFNNFIEGLGDSCNE